MGDNQLGEVSLEIFSIYNSKTEEDLQKPNIEKNLLNLSEIRKDGPTVIFLAFLYFLNSISSGFSSSIPLYVYTYVL